MEANPTLKKRPCRICRKWFRPNPRVGENQKTCAKAKCKDEWHRKKCATWNKQNNGYFKAIYLDKKLELAKENSKDIQTTQNKTLTISRLKLGLSWRDIQEAIGLQQAVIIEYFLQLLFRRVQEEIELTFCKKREKDQ